MPTIKHIIVLMLENRSFDHIFGFAKSPDNQQINNLLTLGKEVFNLLDPSQPESSSNPKFPATSGAEFAVHDKEGPPHSFNPVTAQIAGNAQGPAPTSNAPLNGFVKTYAADLSRRTRSVDRKNVAEVMQSFSPGQLPAINHLAREFCLCDSWFCEVPGPTMPNRMFIHAATSEGYVHNAFKRPYKSRTVYELFEKKGLSWAIYSHDLNEVIQFKALKKIPQHFRRFSSWSTDVSNGNLPNYTFIFPRFLNSGGHGEPERFANSQHAPEDARYADHLIADVYEALAANYELFKQSALIVTYDEHGGFYDHVTPPAAPNPDGMQSPNPDDQANYKVPAFNFDRLGLRVPTIISSPLIPKGIIENRKLQHTSVIKTVTEMFGLDGPLNKRDQSAASFADLFNRLPAPRPASDMPAKLNRPVIEETIESSVAGVDLHPADEPLDSLTEEWTMGMLALLREETAEEAVEEAAPVVPETQGEAAEAIQRGLAAAGL
jgi:phospholipase C